MTEIDPTDEMVAEAASAKRRAAAVSLSAVSLVVALAYAAVAFAGIPPLFLAPLGLTVAMALVVSPVGTTASFFTMWTGRWVNSCTRCHAFSVERMDPVYKMCDACGKTQVEVPPVQGGGWIERTGDGEREHFCSYGCAYDE